jgi:hypothetical protein
VAGVGGYFDGDGPIPQLADQIASEAALLNDNYEELRHVMQDAFAQRKALRLQRRIIAAQLDPQILQPFGGQALCVVRAQRSALDQRAVGGEGPPAESGGQGALGVVHRCARPVCAR